MKKNIIVHNQRDALMLLKEELTICEKKEYLFESKFVKSDESMFKTIVNVIKKD